jgi:hypothetical protein
LKEIEGKARMNAMYNEVRIRTPTSALLLLLMTSLELARVFMVAMFSSYYRWGFHSLFPREYGIS